MNSFWELLSAKVRGIGIALALWLIKLCSRKLSATIDYENKHIKLNGDVLTITFVPYNRTVWVSDDAGGVPLPDFQSWSISGVNGTFRCAMEPRGYLDVTH